LEAKLTSIVQHRRSQWR